MGYMSAYNFLNVTLIHCLSNRSQTIQKKPL